MAKSGLNENIISKYEFYDPSFSSLMQKRIRRILLICSNYEAFLLEEDGRIDEQLFNEYASQNLRFPPSFTFANTASKAFEILKSETIDLVIEMLNIGDSDPFELAKKIKHCNPGLPIVVLTHFSRETLLKVENEDLSAIDYIFCWLGNPDLLLAIVKLLEDRMNLEHDVKQAGVQLILFVEDSIKYISIILPHIYKILFMQSRTLGKDAFNEHHKMLRMRGRPKVMIAKSFDEAFEIFKNYKDYLLGIISDISFKNKGVKDNEAGILLVKKIRSFDPFMPFILQSSNISFKKQAEQLNTYFIYKDSTNLSHELKEVITTQFGFGDFIFRNPVDLKEIARASDLQQFQDLLLKIPEETLIYHIKRNDFSKWLNARAFFSIGNLLKPLTINDFDNTEQVRKFVYDAISNFRSFKGHGIIARFDKEHFNEYLTFSRIGEGSIGGKARGLAFIDHLLHKHKLYEAFDGVKISIPQSVAISVDYFDQFIENNNLYFETIVNLKDDEILKKFIDAELPEELIDKLKVFIKTLKKPLAIRSSSKLEDSTFQTFAGVYNTYMIPYNNDIEKTLKNLDIAIKSVYASVFYQNSRAYLASTSNLIDEEKMGIIIQEICGHEYNNYFYPTISGVARSINYYPAGNEKPQDGIANIAFGLGRLVVEGKNYSLRFSPKYPDKLWQFSSVEDTLKYSQKYFYALDLNSNKFITSTNDGINLAYLPIEQATGDRYLRYAISYYNINDNILSENYVEGYPIITFSPVLKHMQMPIAKILENLLKICEYEMNHPVEIEFAAEPGIDNKLSIFYVLQIRPVIPYRNEKNSAPEISKNNALIFSTMTLGNGVNENIFDIVIVKKEKYNSLITPEIAAEIELINNQFVKERKNYILIGYGRWGTKDNFLGIPVNWAQISNVIAIVEICDKKNYIEPSQGTHFFQNLTTFGVGYFTINDNINESFIDTETINSMPTFYEGKYIKHIKTNKPLTIKIDGKTNKGIIYKSK
jgi:hypothetical protein